MDVKFACIYIYGVLFGCVVRHHRSNRFAHLLVLALHTAVARTMFVHLRRDGIGDGLSTALGQGKKGETPCNPVGGGGKPSLL